MELTVITRLTLGQSTTVILLRGCLTLDDLAPGGDLIAVTATRKISDTPDLTAVDSLLLLTRDTVGGFTTRLDNTARYAGR